MGPIYAIKRELKQPEPHYDKVGLTFTSDRDMIPGPADMRQCLDEAVEQVRLYLK